MYAHTIFLEYFRCRNWPYSKKYFSNYNYNYPIFRTCIVRYATDLAMLDILRYENLKKKHDRK